MRILYVAPDQTVPGTSGGSVHVQAVALGLAQLGHDVHVAATQGGPWPGGPDSGVTWHHVRPPLGRAQLRWMRTGAVTTLARQVDADVIIERYYNFGGEGVRAARTLGRPAVLEVNAPVVDYPGSPKAMIDRLLITRPLARWRERLCQMTQLFITPTAEILPSWIDRRRVLETEWGADTDRFQPQRATAPPFPRMPGRIVCVFAGAFRSWHGAQHLASALARLHQAGDRRFTGVFIGSGPEREATERASHGVPGVLFTGAIPHDRMPEYLAAADIGVAPFDPARHPSLQLAFYWSPLKVFEYMAAGLPVVAPSLPRLAQLIGHDREGWLYDPADPAGLDRALVSLADESVRRRLGDAARARAVREFSWTAHVAALETRLRALVKR